MLLAAPCARWWLWGSCGLAGGSARGWRSGAPGPRCGAAAGGAQDSQPPGLEGSLRPEALWQCLPPPRAHLLLQPRSLSPGLASLPLTRLKIHRCADGGGAGEAWQRRAPPGGEAASVPTAPPGRGALPPSPPFTNRGRRGIHPCTLIHPPPGASPGRSTRPPSQPQSQRALMTVTQCPLPPRKPGPYCSPEPGIKSQLLHAPGPAQGDQSVSFHLIYFLHPTSLAAAAVPNGSGL